MKSLGGLWRRESKKGLVFFSGQIACDKCGHVTKLVCFENNKKQNEKSPDVNIYLSQDNRQKDTNNATKPVKKARPKSIFD